MANLLWPGATFWTALGEKLLPSGFKGEFFFFL